MINIVLIIEFALDEGTAWVAGQQQASRDLQCLTGAQIGQYREDAPVGVVGVRDVDLAE
jgi:hypothetical protein